MKFRNKHIRRFLRRKCKNEGVEFSQKNWLVRKHLRKTKRERSE